MLLFAALRRSERSFSLALLKKQPQVFENNRWDGTIVFRIISAAFFAQKKSEKSEATQTVNSSAKMHLKYLHKHYALAPYAHMWLTGPYPLPKSKS